jgi:hypothetical protein
MLAPLLTVTAAFAWGPTGHRVVGHIAERHLSPTTRAAVERLMGAESLARASTWPDEIRSDPAWQKKAPNDWRQHFINAPKGEDLRFEPTDADGKPANNLLSAVRRYESVLADRDAPPEDRRVAMRWLVHLAGDAHQPLHTGTGADRGANSITVAWFDEKTNLHTVWDERIIQHTELSYTELADFIDYAAASDIEAWQAAPVETWLTESRALMPDCYEIDDGWLSYNYMWRHRPTVERRLLQAGWRLAGQLDRLLGSDGPSKRKGRRR